jgi:hypothetical protein
VEHPFVCDNELLQGRPWRPTLAAAILGAVAAGCATDATTRDPPPLHPARVASASSGTPRIASAAPTSSGSADVAEAIAKWKSGKPVPTSEPARPFLPAGGDPFQVGKKGPTVSVSLSVTAMTDGEDVVVILDGEVACKRPVAGSGFWATFSFSGDNGEVLRDGSLDLAALGLFGGGGSADPEPVEGRAGVFAISGDPGFRGKAGRGALISVALETACGEFPDLATFVIAIPSEGPPRLRLPTPAELQSHGKR